MTNENLYVLYIKVKGKMQNDKDSRWQLADSKRLVNETKYLPAIQGRKDGLPASSQQRYTGWGMDITEK